MTRFTESTIEQAARRDPKGLNRREGSPIGTNENVFHAANFGRRPLGSEI